MQTLELLSETRTLLSESCAWTQDVYARDSGGLPADPLGREARAWCAYGALLKVASDHGLCARDVQPAVDALEAALPKTFATRRDLSGPVVAFPSPAVPGAVFDYNDGEGTDHATVLRWFSAAIASLDATQALNLGSKSRYVLP